MKLPQCTTLSCESPAHAQKLVKIAAYGQTVDERETVRLGIMGCTKHCTQASLKNVQGVSDEFKKNLLTQWDKQGKGNPNWYSAELVWRLL